jgi:hypothetical protein
MLVTDDQVDLLQPPRAQVSAQVRPGWAVRGQMASSLRSSASTSRRKCIKSGTSFTNSWVNWGMFVMLPVYPPNLVFAPEFKRTTHYILRIHGDFALVGPINLSGNRFGGEMANAS